MKTNETKRAAARYLKIVEWSDEDGCFVGRCPGLFFGGVHGDDEAQVYAELVEVVEGHVADLLEGKKALPPSTAGKKYSGKFLVRIDPDVHEAVAIKAMMSPEGSLNSYVASALVKSLAPAPAH